MDLRKDNGGAEPPPQPAAAAAAAPPRTSIEARRAGSGGSPISPAAAAANAAKASSSPSALRQASVGGNGLPGSAFAGIAQSRRFRSLSDEQQHRKKVLAAQGGGGGGGGGGANLDVIYSNQEFNADTVAAALDGGSGGGSGSRAKRRRRRRKRRSPWLSAPMILGSEVASNIAYYSISTNMVIYLRQELSYLPDKAALVSSALIGSSYIAVLGGGMVADGLLGRAKTVLASSVTFVLGLSLLTLSAFFVDRLRARYGLQHIRDTSKVHNVEHGADVTLFYVANVLIALAIGGIKPNVSALGADQFDDFDPKTGEPLDDKSVFFGWYYFFINVGALLAATVLVWVQTSGRWTLGFAIPTAISALAAGIYLLGWRGYRKYPPGGPPLNRVFRVLWLAFRNRRAELPEDPLDLYEADLDEQEALAAEQEQKLLAMASRKKMRKASVVVGGDGDADGVGVDGGVDGGSGGGGGSSGGKKGFLSGSTKAQQDDETDSDDEAANTALLLDELRAAPPLAHTPSMRFLDRAAVVPAGVSWPLYGDPPPTEFVPVSQVEETKQLFRIMPVWATLLIWNLGYAQLATIMVQQADSMKRTFGRSTFEIPPASVSVFATATILVLVPFWDRVVRPLLERRSWAPTTLQRMGASHALMALSFVVASAVEFKRTSNFRLRVLERQSAASPGQLGNMPGTDTSIFWIAPQILVMGVSEFFFIGAIEFFYQQSPERMRSLAAALELVAFGIASYLNTALISVVGSRTDWLPGDWADGNSMLEYYYLLIAGLCILNLIVFLWPVAAKYTYREFEPPKRNDVTVAFGRSVAGLNATKAFARPLSATLSRAPTIKPYASSALMSARMSRAVSGGRTFSRPLSAAASRDSFSGGAAAAAALSRFASGSGALTSIGEASREGDSTVGASTTVPPPQQQQRRKVNFGEKGDKEDSALDAAGSRRRSRSLDGVDDGERRLAGSSGRGRTEAAAALAAAAAASSAASSAAAQPPPENLPPISTSPSPRQQQQQQQQQQRQGASAEHLGPLGFPSSSRRAGEQPSSPLASPKEEEEEQDDEKKKNETKKK